MKATLTHIITAAAAVAAAPAALTAQQLEQEVEVSRQVVVDHYDASRIALTPKLILPTLQQQPLSYSDRTVAIDMPTNISFLEPTAYADTLATSPYNGYASIGYLPIYNLGASAGYKIVDNDRLRLNTWMQYNGSSYKDSRTPALPGGEAADRNIWRHTVTAAVTAHTMLGKRSEIDASLQYTFARFNAPGTQTRTSAGLAGDLYAQSVNRINTSATFFSAIGGLRYSAGASYEYFGYRDGAPTSLLGYYEPATAFDPVREHVIRFGALGQLPMSKSSSVILGIDVEMLDDTRRSFLENDATAALGYRLHSRRGDNCHGFVSLRPAYRVANDILTLHIGLNAQASFHSGKILHIAPAVKASWTPAAAFTIWGEAGGGEHLNTLSSLYDVNYMTAPMLAYGDSHLPLTVEGGIVAGPFRGAYAELFGGYAIANDWLMPLGFPACGFGPTLFKAIDMRGWHAGVRLGYKYKNLGEARISAEAAPQSYDRGYYLWRDRAKYVIKAEVTARPIDRLDVGVSYELRARRALLDRTMVVDGVYLYNQEFGFNLGNVSLLNIHGAYQLTKQLSVSLNLENLLNRRVSTLGLVESQGITGLAGVSYKF